MAAALGEETESERRNPKETEKQERTNKRGSNRRSPPTGLDFPRQSGTKDKRKALREDPSERGESQRVPLPFGCRSVLFVSEQKQPKIRTLPGQNGFCKDILAAIPASTLATVLVTNPRQEK
jgi:hypothetical protein